MASRPKQVPLTRAIIPRDGFLVLGAHRSGTSAISGTLAKLGATPPKTLMEGLTDNPKGHWESVVLMQFHDELLASAGSRWDDWRPFNPGWYNSPLAAQFKKRARALLAAEFGDSPSFVLKDPRICRFAPFWLDVFEQEGITPRLIIPVRNPLEVAQSLKTRDGSSLNKGLLLWLRHTLDAEATTRDMPRAFVEWDAFLKDWRPEADRIATELDVHWPRLSDFAAAEVDEFLSAELKRERVAPESARAHPDMHEWATLAYDALLELARNPGSNSARVTLDELRERFEEACRLFGRTLGGLELELGTLRKELESEHQGRMQVAQAQAEAVSEAQVRTAEAEQLRAALQAERDALSLESQQRESAVQGLSQALELERVRAAELERLRAEARQGEEIAAQALEAALAAERMASAQDSQNHAQTLEQERARIAELEGRHSEIRKAHEAAVHAAQALEAALAAERETRSQDAQDYARVLEQERARAAELERLHTEARQGQEAAVHATQVLEAALAAERESRSHEAQNHAEALERERARAAELERLHAEARQAHEAALHAAQALEAALVAERDMRAQDARNHTQVMEQESARAEELERLHAEARQVHEAAVHAAGAIEETLAAERVAGEDLKQALDAEQQTRLHEVRLINDALEDARAREANLQREHDAAITANQAILLSEQQAREESARFAKALDDHRTDHAQLQQQLQEVQAELAVQQEARRRDAAALEDERRRQQEVQAELAAQQEARRRDAATLEEERRRQAEMERRHGAALQDASRAMVTRIEAVHQTYKTSTSWRITQPLRNAKRFLPFSWRSPAPSRANFVAPPAFGVEPTATETLSTYRLPGRLANYLNERFSGEAILLVRGLMEILQEYEGDPQKFDRSKEFFDLVAHIKSRAGEPPPDHAVDATIIIPVHNGALFTLTCLVSVLEHATDFRFEVLVGDDSSTDATQEALAGIGGRVRYVRHEKNLGFLQNCNAMARLSRGRYLIFLNNDTIALPGWLDYLVRTLRDGKNVGLAGSKLLNGDGSLQEAGGILWDDASGWNFGRNQDPWLPEFNYVRDTDYCSGASMAIAKTLWDTLKGFDVRFAPAYCEDSDLAFRVRKAGFRTVYQPRSELIHHEGRSHGRDLNSGLKAYQVRNQKQLRDIWKETFRSEHLPNGEDLFVARDRTSRKPHILIIDHYVPQWDRDAGSRTMYHFIRAFLESGFQITFWPDNLYFDREYTETLQQLGVEVIYGPEYLNRFQNWMQTNGKWIPYVLLSRPHIATNYIDVLKAESKAKLLYYGHDLHWKRLTQEYEVTGKSELLPLIKETRKLEAHVSENCNVVMYPTAEECAILRHQFGEQKSVVETPAWYFSAAEIESTRASLDRISRNDPYHLLFVGGFTHGPNVDAMLWFVQQVYPILTKHESRFHLTIVGSNAPSSIQELASRAIEFAGQVSDRELDRLYNLVGMSVVPLRFGGGVKGKVIEAFAKGVPVVSTSTGMQGIDKAAELAFVGDEPEEFARAILDAAQNRELAQSKAQRALSFLQRKYSLRSFVESLGHEMHELRAVKLDDLH